jgi:hypothetical protein
MSQELDPVLDAFIGGLQMPDVTPEDDDDAILKIIGDGSLAVFIGHTAVERFNKEISHIDTQVRKSRTAPAPANDWDAPLTNDSHRLEKRDRAISFYVDWLSTAMAKTAKTSEEIISQWKEEFPHAKPDIVQAIQEAAQILATA